MTEPTDLTTLKVPTYDEWLAKQLDIRTNPFAKGQFERWKSERTDLEPAASLYVRGAREDIPVENVLEFLEKTGKYILENKPTHLQFGLYENHLGFTAKKVDAGFDLEQDYRWVCYSKFLKDHAQMFISRLCDFMHYRPNPETTPSDKDGQE